jgi:hypothetical protein
MVLRKHSISGALRACKGFRDASDIVKAMQLLVERGAILGERQWIDLGKDQGQQLIHSPFDGSVEDFVHQKNRVVRDDYRKERLKSFQVKSDRLEDCSLMLLLPNLRNERGDIQDISLRFINFFPYNETVATLLLYSNDLAEVNLQVNELLNMMKTLNGIFSPMLGILDYLPSFSIDYGKPILEKKLKAIYWVNFFGPEYVAKYGREFLLNAPGWKKEELHDGGVFYQLSPLITETDQGRQLQELADYFAPVGVRNLAWPKSGKER